MIRVMSHEGTPFSGRVEAGQILGSGLFSCRGSSPVVLGIPRGGVVVAAQIAEIIGGMLDVTLARKLRAPSNPELAIGAMSETGATFLDNELCRLLRVNDQQIFRERQRVSEEIERNSKLYREARPKVELCGKTVIVADDGLATGSTMKAALASVTREKPAKLICVVPVAANEGLEQMESFCDEVICLRVPKFFAAVGQFYEDFPIISDDEVLAILSQHM